MSNILRIKEAEQLHDIWKKEYATQRGNTKFLGIETQRNPIDAWIFQEIIFEKQPDLIIEVGTYKGGTTLFLATICDALNKGNVLGVDNFVLNRPPHPRITHIIGNSIDLPTFEQVRNIARTFKSVMIILDSDHRTNHVIKELELYSSLVSVGQYLIVDDTEHEPQGDGPYPAVIKFLKEHVNFEIDKSRERFHLTNCPNGFLFKKHA